MNVDCQMTSSLFGLNLSKHERSPFDTLGVNGYV